MRVKDDVRKRAVDGATGADMVKKENLPKVMQVKNFGRSGQTKYTHLADQDTSNWESGWFKKRDLYVWCYTAPQPVPLHTRPAHLLNPSRLLPLLWQAAFGTR